MLLEFAHIAVATLQALYMHQVMVLPFMTSGWFPTKKLYWAVLLSVLAVDVRTDMVAL